VLTKPSGVVGYGLADGGIGTLCAAVRGVGVPVDAEVAQIAVDLEQDVAGEARFAAAATAYAAASRCAQRSLSRMSVAPTGSQTQRTRSSPRAASLVPDDGLWEPIR